MAKAFYVSVNGVSKKVKKWYVSVGGVSKNVKKAYCSVNGVSRLFFGEIDPSDIFQNGTFNNSPFGTSLSNLSPICWYNTGTPYADASNYYGTNKSILVEFNSTLVDYNYYLDNDNAITLSFDAPYGPNYSIWIPINRTTGYTKLKYTAKGSSRVYVGAGYTKPNDTMLYSNGSALAIPTGDYQEYTVNLTDGSQYIDYICITTEQGCPHIKKIWLDN